MTKYIVFILLMSLSCKKEKFDLDKFHGTEAGPELAIPFIYTILDIKNLINDTSQSEIGADGLIQFVYRRDSIYSIMPSDMLVFSGPVKTQTGSNLGTISIPNVQLNSGITVSAISAGLDNANKTLLDSLVGKNTILPAFLSINGPLFYLPIDTTFFSSIDIQSGTLDITAYNNLPVAITELTTYLYALNPQRYIAKVTLLNIAPNGSKTTTLNLANLTITGPLGYRVTKCLSGSSSPNMVKINYTDSIGMNYQFNNLVAKGGSMNLSTVKFNKTNDYIDISTNNSAQKITKLTLVKGKIKYLLNSTIREQIDVKINFPTASKLSLPFPEQVISIPYSPINQIAGFIDIANVSFELNSNVLKPYNILPFTTEAIIGSSGKKVLFYASNSFTIQLFIDEIEIDYAEGNFETGANFVFNFKEQIDFFKQFQSGFHIDDATLKLKINNGFGIPLQINFDMIAENLVGTKQGLGITPFNLSSPSLSQVGQVISITNIYNKTNSNISSFCNLPPNSINFNGMASVGAPGPGPAYNNFIKKDKGLNVGIEMNLPLAISGKNIALSDTLKFEGSLISELNVKNLAIKFTNAFPFDAHVIFKFVNDTFLTLDSFYFSKAISAGYINPAGRIVRATENTVNIPIDTAVANKLKHTKQLIFSIYFSSPDDGTKWVKIYSDYFLKIGIGIISKQKFKL